MSICQRRAIAKQRQNTIPFNSRGEVKTLKGRHAVAVCCKAC
jgi:hypothetical protein